MRRPQPKEPVHKDREYKREPLTGDEMNAIANACETVEEKLVVWTLMDTGLRVSEFCSIDRNMIDWQHQRVTIRGKRNKRRQLLLKGRTWEILSKYVSMHDRVDIGVRKTQRIVDRTANRAKITRPCSPHVLRHSFSVNAIRKGVPLPALMKMLGHERLATTQIYANMSPEDVIAVMDKFL